MKKKLILYLNYITCFIAHMIPKKKTRWVFGAWFGNRISDNPYALYQSIVKAHPEIEAIWICNDEQAGRGLGLNAVRRDSVRGIWKCLTARVSVMNQGYLDLGSLNWIHGSYRVQLWHGVPWKKIGEDTTEERHGLLRKMSHATYLFVNRCDLYISPSEETKKVVKTAFLTDVDHILEVGQPRNEALLDTKHCEVVKRRILRELGDYAMLAVYLPTFRDSGSASFSFADIREQIAPVLLKYNAAMLEKKHFVDYERGGDEAMASDRIIDATRYDTQDLLAAADLLITDYSSCFFDFILRDKPIIHYLYDYELYRDNDRGLYYDSSYVTAGQVTTNQQELVSAIESALAGQDRGAERRALIRDRFATYESSRNSEIIVRRILGSM